MLLLKILTAVSRCAYWLNNLLVPTALGHSDELPVRSQARACVRCCCSLATLLPPWQHAAPPRRPTRPRSGPGGGLGSCGWPQESPSLPSQHSRQRSGAGRAMREPGRGWVLRTRRSGASPPRSRCLRVRPASLASTWLRAAVLILRTLCQGNGGTSKCVRIEFQSASRSSSPTGACVTRHMGGRWSWTRSAPSATRSRARCRWRWACMRPLRPASQLRWRWCQATRLRCWALGRRCCLPRTSTFCRARQVRLLAVGQIRQMWIMP